MVVGTKVVFVCREIKKALLESLHMCVYRVYERIIPRLALPSGISQHLFMKWFDFWKNKVIAPRYPAWENLSDVLLYLKHITVSSLSGQSTTRVPTLKLKVSTYIGTWKHFVTATLMPESVIYSPVFYYFVICAKTCSRGCLLGERVRVSRSHLYKMVSIKWCAVEWFLKLQG